MCNTIIQLVTTIQWSNKNYNPQIFDNHTLSFEFTSMIYADATMTQVARRKLSWEILQSKLPILLLIILYNLLLSRYTTSRTFTATSYIYFTSTPGTFWPKNTHLWSNGNQNKSKIAVHLGYWWEMIEIESLNNCLQQRWTKLKETLINLFP